MWDATANNVKQLKHKNYRCYHAIVRPKASLSHFTRLIYSML